MNEEQIIPTQEGGMQKDFEYSTDCKTLAAAKGLFDEARHRLLSINNWHTYGGKLSADFTLSDFKGTALERPASVGDYIKIDIPGPPLPHKKYDWVHVTAIRYDAEENGELISMQLNPTTDPALPMEDTAHFFKEEASSTFILKREERTVTISYHGRNEKANTSTDSVQENIRNFLVGISAMLGFSNLQWQSLIKGIIAQADT